MDDDSFNQGSGPYSSIDLTSNSSTTTTADSQRSVSNASSSSSLNKQIAPIFHRINSYNSAIAAQNQSQTSTPTNIIASPAQNSTQIFAPQNLNLNQSQNQNQNQNQLQSQLSFQPPSTSQPLQTSHAAPHFQPSQVQATQVVSTPPATATLTTTANATTVPATASAFVPAPAFDSAFGPFGSSFSFAFGSSSGSDAGSASHNASTPTTTAEHSLKRTTQSPLSTPYSSSSATSHVVMPFLNEAALNNGATLELPDLESEHALSEQSLQRPASDHNAHETSSKRACKSLQKSPDNLPCTFTGSKFQSPPVSCNFPDHSSSQAQTATPAPNKQTKTTTSSTTGTGLTTSKAKLNTRSQAFGIKITDNPDELDNSNNVPMQAGDQCSPTPNASVKVGADIFARDHTHSSHSQQTNTPLSPPFVDTKINTIHAASSTPSNSSSSSSSSSSPSSFPPPVDPSRAIDPPIHSTPSLATCANTLATTPTSTRITAVADAACLPTSLPEKVHHLAISDFSAESAAVIHSPTASSSPPFFKQVSLITQSTSTATTTDSFSDNDQNSDSSALTAFVSLDVVKPISPISSHDSTSISQNTNSIVRTATPFSKSSNSTTKTPSPTTPVPIIDSHLLSFDNFSKSPPSPQALLSSPLPSTPSKSTSQKQHNDYLDTMVLEEQNLHHQHNEQQRQLLRLEHQKQLLQRQQHELLNQQRQLLAGSSDPLSPLRDPALDMDSDEYEHILSHDDDASSIDTEDDLDSSRAPSSAIDSAFDSMASNKRATMTRQTVLDEFENDIRDLLLLDSASPFTDLKLNFIQPSAPDAQNNTLRLRDPSNDSRPISQENNDIPEFHNTSNLNTPTAPAFVDPTDNVSPNFKPTLKPGFAPRHHNSSNTDLYPHIPDSTASSFIFSPETTDPGGSYNSLDGQKGLTSTPDTSMATATSIPASSLAPSAPVVPTSRQFEQTPYPSEALPASPTASSVSARQQRRKHSSHRFSSAQQLSPQSIIMSSPSDEKEHSKDARDSRFFHRKNGSTKSSSSSTFAWLMDESKHAIDKQDKHLLTSVISSPVTASKDEKRPSLVHKTSNMSLSSKLRGSSAFRLSSYVSSSSSDNNPNVITNLNYHQHFHQQPSAPAPAPPQRDPSPQSSDKRPVSAQFIDMSHLAQKPKFEQLQTNPSIIPQWFLKQVLLSHSQNVGLFLTPHLFLPSNLWQVLNVTPKLLDSRVECLHAASNVGAVFLQNAHQLYDDDQNPKSFAVIEQLVDQQTQQLASLEQQFHIAFIEPLSASPPSTTSSRPTSTDFHLVNNAVSRLSTLTLNNSTESSPSTVKSPTAVASRSSPGASSSRKSRNSYAPTPGNSFGEPPLSTPTSIASSVAEPQHSLATRYNSSLIEEYHEAFSSREAGNLHPQSTAGTMSSLAQSVLESRSGTTRPTSLASGASGNEPSLAIYLAALPALISVLENLHDLAEEFSGDTGPVDVVVVKWVQGYRRFVSKVVCRLILKDVLYLVDVYQTQIRDWILS